MDPFQIFQRILIVLILLCPVTRFSFVLNFLIFHTHSTALEAVVATTSLNVEMIMHIVH